MDELRRIASKEIGAMALLETRYEHIVLDEDGVPRIAGTGTKIIELVLDKLAYGWSPEEIQFQHPHLTLGQVYSALAYYSDHRQELDRDIENRLRQVDKLQAAAEPSPSAAYLKAMGLPIVGIEEGNSSSSFAGAYSA